MVRAQRFAGGSKTRQPFLYDQMPTAAQRRGQQYFCLTLLDSEGQSQRNTRRLGNDGIVRAEEGSRRAPAIGRAPASK